MEEVTSEECLLSSSLKAVACDEAFVASALWSFSKVASLALSVSRSEVSDLEEVTSEEWRVTSSFSEVASDE